MLTLSQNSKQFRANIMLLIVTGIWGGTFPLIKNSLNFIRPGDFVSVRFALATCAMLPFVMHRLNKTNRTVLIHGFVLGALNYVGYYAQTLSLKTQSSANSAFITALYVPTERTESSAIPTFIDPLGLVIVIFP